MDLSNGEWFVGHFVDAPFFLSLPRDGMVETVRVDEHGAGAGPARPTPLHPHPCWCQRDGKPRGGSVGSEALPLIDSLCEIIKCKAVRRHR